MARKRDLQLGFPTGGLNKRAAYRQQRPFTTPDCLNVRPIGVIENRERGGSRPGLINSFQNAVPGSSAIRMLAPMTVALGDNFTAWTDQFRGSTLATSWATASWATGPVRIDATNAALAETADADAAVVTKALTIDSTESSVVEMFIAPYENSFHGKYQIFLRMDNSSPAIATEGVKVELITTGVAYTGSLTSYIGGVPTVTAFTPGSLSSIRPGWLTVRVEGDNIWVYWNNTGVVINQAVSTHTGVRTGFGMECTVASKKCLADLFRVQYYSTVEATPSRSMLVASANGSISYENRYGFMTGLTLDLSVRDDVSLDASQGGQKLYIADYGDLRITQTDGIISGGGNDELTATANPDWSTKGISVYDDVCVLSDCNPSSADGTYEISAVVAGKVTLATAPGAATSCTFRIERCPKIYDPSTRLLTRLIATEGQVPTGCPLAIVHLNRLFLGGAEIAPYAWYAARWGTETDFDYSQTDSRTAVAGTTSNQGIPGSPLTAFIPHSADYLILGCRNELWVLRGDPAYDGSLMNLSRKIGVIGKGAWCATPTGETVFMSTDGVYVLPPSGQNKPVPLSRKTIPDELLQLDPTTTEVLLEYDVADRGVHIYIAGESYDSRLHWWLDWETKTFWPVSLQADHEPTETCVLQGAAVEDSGVVLGGRDGFLRVYHRLAENDAGSAVSSYVDLGPIALAKDSQLGVVDEMDAVIGEDGGNVAWSLKPALTWEAASSASAFKTGVWVPGLNGTVRPGGRGQCFTLRMAGVSSRKWTFETIKAKTKEAGRRRIA
ncbi:MAG: hypothetical protein GY906_23985 [bacterium]|nr:hypothetical protein [bacterium]